MLHEERERPLKRRVCSSEVRSDKALITQLKPGCNGRPCLGLHRVQSSKDIVRCCFCGSEAAEACRSGSDHNRPEQRPALIGSQEVASWQANGLSGAPV